MRYYFIDTDDEYIVDLSRCKVHSPEMVEYTFSHIDDDKIYGPQQVYIRQLAGKYFSSLDGVSWKKLAKQHMPTEMLNVDRVMKMYRGFKPSGLAGDSEGELTTNMPGKVVKILVEPGQKVSQGEPVLILEAMKMENEIKAPTEGIVKTVYVSEGDTLEQGVLMIDLE
jgi:biotin carboxyl carrier protein